MKILLDNCVHRWTKRLLPGHEVRHASEVGWSRLANGRLLRAAADAGFDLMLTVDQNMRYQQPLDRLPLPVLELTTPDVRFPALTAITPFFQDAISVTLLHRFVSVDPTGRITIVQPGPV